MPLLDSLLGVLLTCGNLKQMGINNRKLNRIATVLHGVQFLFMCVPTAPLPSPLVIDHFVLHSRSWNTNIQPILVAIFTFDLSHAPNRLGASVGVPRFSEFRLPVTYRYDLEYGISWVVRPMLAVFSGLSSLPLGNPFFTDITLLNSYLTFDVDQKTLVNASAVLYSVSWSHAMHPAVMFRLVFSGIVFETTQICTVDRELAHRPPCVDLLLLVRALPRTHHYRVFQ